ncbi:hypothetical protein [Herbiconiux sp. VKM Ac-2851]|uniref:hypothetical protein n=1 Tax=Herbiconiux sp. VKM Ac-2851 TaxID=2739025 RepID=UPI0015644968|nr:hypothetical protein [Herbiconiux sp. VKM Ac-2851]NQX34651.1 hypothetical protein [Herbiconiux sp. VKM Ac-2851]
MIVSPLRVMAALGAALILLSVHGCARSGLRELSESDLDEIAAAPACVNPVALKGDPDFSGAAAGIYCIPESGQGVVVMLYEDAGATFEVINDWADLITEDNPIVYTDRWFATGPRGTLTTLLGGFRSSGPQPVAPDATTMTATQQDVALCSSITYGVVADLLVSTDERELDQYFANYPGLEGVAERVAREAAVEYPGGGGEDLVARAFLTRWDDVIKGYCGSRPDP